MKILTALFLLGAMAAPATASEETAQRFCRGELLEIGQTPGTPKKGECVVDPIAKTITISSAAAPEDKKKLQENPLTTSVALMLFKAMLGDVCLKFEDELTTRHVFFDPNWRFIIRMGDETMFRCNLPVKP